MNNNGIVSADEQTEVSNYRRLEKIGDYRIIRLLAIGGMGEVFLAEQQSMQRIVALKILPPALANNQHYLERFFLEVRTLAKIEHPNIVKAIEGGAENDVCFFSMLYVKGQDLHRLLEKTGPFDELKALNIIREVAIALDYVWKKHRLVHRDIKPSNIMLAEDGQVKLLDLGISKTAAAVPGTATAELTRVGIMVGSPHYVSPEQARSEKIDFRADMYSLGATLYHLLSGRPPFDGKSNISIVSCHLHDPAPDVREINAALNPATAGLIKKMMDKNPGGRYQDWDIFIAETERIIQLLETHRRRTENATGKLYNRVSVIFEKIFSSSFRTRRIMVLLLVLLLFLAAMAQIIRWSIAEAEYKRNTAYYQSALQFAAHCKPEECGEAIARLETVIRSAPPATAATAEAAREKIRQSIIAERKNTIMDNVEKNLALLKAESYNLEKEGKLEAAIKLWQYHRASARFKNDKIFIREVERSLTYLRRLQEKKQAGIAE